MKSFHFLRARRVIARTVFAIVLIASFSIHLAAPVFAAGGQTGNVSGNVTDTAKVPIAGAIVTLASPLARLVAKTDPRGFFSFLDVPIDTYTISVQAEGIEPYSQTGISVFGGNTLDLGTVRIERGLKTIGRIRSRSASSAFAPNQTIPQFTVTGSQLEDTQGKKASANINAALLAVPGFQTDSSGGLVLQGSLRDQIRYQIDGVDFSEPGGNGSVNNGFFNGISTLQVVPGAGDPSQGDAGAGAVNLVVKQGSNPGKGLLDAEIGSRIFAHQMNVEYGIATSNNRVSEYFSFFGKRFGANYGAFGQSAFDTNTPYQASNYVQNDFINNLIFHFGKNNSQRVQFLYQNGLQQSVGNYGGVQLFYPSNSPDLLPLAGTNNGLTNAQNASLLSPEVGQTSLNGRIFNPLNNNSLSSLVKLEYDNALDSSTNLALRYFHSTSYAEGFAAGPTIQGPFSVTGTSSTSGGARTGFNFEIDKQLGSKNLVTVSGSYSLDHPVFSAYGPTQGLNDLGNNAIDFLRPANPNLPVDAATNPCPVDGGCYLQQFFYTKGGTPKVPPLALAFTGRLRLNYGLGIRDQIQVTNAIRADLGLRYDTLNEGFGNDIFYAGENTQPVPGSPTTPYIDNYGFVNHPHFLEPRAGLSFRITRNDSLGLTYGRSIILPGSSALATPENPSVYTAFAGIPVNPNFKPSGNPFTGVALVGPGNCLPNVPFAVGATATSKPSYNGTLAGVNPSLQLGRPCANYAELLYGVNDAFFPEISAAQPGQYDNYDITIGHLFKNGSALKLNPYYRRGFNTLAITAPLVFIPSSGTYQPGTLTNTSFGKSTTTGVDLQYTLPDRPVGFTGFLSVSYVNEFSNTPPSSDNPYAQDQQPIILPASLAAGNVYKVGFVSPLVSRLGISYRSKGGLRINPVITLNNGYPYGAGLLTPTTYQGLGINVPNTNFTDQFGPGGTSQYVDPANPGSIFKPNVAATRGTSEKPSGGGNLSRPQLTGDVTLEFTPPKSRMTFGAQVLDLFNNAYFQVPSINGNYYPVTTGIGGPLTGQSASGATTPTLAPLVARANSPYGAYTVSPVTGINAPLPTSFRLYMQVGL